MQTYRILIQPDIRTGTNTPAYTAFVPTLGIATDGDTIDETLFNAKEAIEAFVHSLKADGLDVPREQEGSYLVGSAQVSI
jgi:predicted RNase H-like HicB family nuclease